MALERNDRKMKRIRTIQNQIGAAAVEFAIVLPLLIALIFGTIELALYVFNKHVVTNASREGARAGIVARAPDRLSNAEVEAVVLNYCQTHLVTFGANNPPVVSLKPINNDSDTFDSVTERCTRFGCDLEVQVDYDYGFLVLSNFGFSPKTIRAVSLMKME